MRIIKIAYGLALLSLMVAGCVNENWQGSANAASLRTDRLKSAWRISGTNDAVGAQMAFEYELPLDPDLAAFVDGHIAKTYEDACGRTVSGLGMPAVMDEFARQYREFGLEEDWQLDCSGRFVWFNTALATYRTTVFSYVGGVHPDLWYGNATYDRNAGRRITLGDLFDESDIVSVVNVIRRKIAADESRSGYLREKCSNDVSGVAADYLGKCDGGELKVTENFMIVEHGVVWTYNEYEISSYSEGATDVFVPWEDIAGYLRESARGLVTMPTDWWSRVLDSARKNGDLIRVGDLMFLKN